MLNSIFTMVILTCSIFNTNFVLDSLDEAKDLSKSTGQPILVIFGTDDCQFCTKLKLDISNGVLIDSLDKYIVCYIDITENIKYKNQYNISVIPDSRIIINNKEISKATGYTKEKYIKWLVR